LPGIDGGEGLRQAILKVGGVQLHHEAVASHTQLVSDSLYTGRSSPACELVAAPAV
jgi:hypothetical protein